MARKCPNQPGSKEEMCYDYKRKLLLKLSQIQIKYNQIKYNSDKIFVVQMHDY